MHHTFDLEFYKQKKSQMLPTFVHVFVKFYAQVFPQLVYDYSFRRLSIVNYDKFLSLLNVNPITSDFTTNAAHRNNGKIFINRIYFSSLICHCIVFFFVEHFTTRHNMPVFNN